MNTKLQKFIDKIESSNKILIIAAKPVDYDCVGTSLAIKYWLSENYGKEARNIVFQPIPDMYKKIPEITDLENPDSVDFGEFDLIILVDGNSFNRFFGRNIKDAMAQIEKDESLFCIDHHVEDDVAKRIPDGTFRIEASSTAEVFYTEVLEQIDTKISTKVCRMLAIALLGDTQNFNVSIYPRTFEFAAFLRSKLENFVELIDFVGSYPKKQFEFMQFLVSKTNYFPEAQTTIVKIDTELKKEIEAKFGDDWEAQRLDMTYKDLFLRSVDGFIFGIILIENEDGSVFANWRCSSFNKDISILEILKQIRFVGGGHLNAGSARAENTDLNLVEEHLLSELKK